MRRTIYKITKRVKVKIIKLLEKVKLLTSGPQHHFVFYNSFFGKSVTILSICKQRFISCGSQLNSGEMIWNWLVCNFLSSRYIAIILQQRNVLTKQFGNHFHLNRFKLKQVRLRFKDKAPAYTELCSREG